MILSLEDDRRTRMNIKTLIAVIASVSVILACPCLTAIDCDAACEDSADAGIGVAQMRTELGNAGVDVSEMSDSEVALCWGWWANKNLIGEYSWDDPTGVNWLLEQAGVDGSIDSISVVGGAVSIVSSGVSIVLASTAAGIVGILVASGLLVYDLYLSILQENALEKAELALELMVQQKDYAVYETTVMWNTVVNGYDVEEC